MEDGQCKAFFVLHCNSSPQLQGYPCHSSVWRSSSLLHMQHAPQHLANKGTQPLFKTKETSIAFDIFTLHHYKEILFGLKEVCSISNGHPCSSLAHGPFRAPLWRCTGKKKRSIQMLPITDAPLQALLFHQGPGFRANQMSLKASPLSGVLGKTTDEL